MPKTKQELEELKKERNILISKFEQLSDDELEEVNGGLYDPNDTYFGWGPEMFGNFKINDRVKRYNIFGTDVWHYGTVKGFDLEPGPYGYLITTHSPGACRVLVLWDNIGSPRPDGCHSEFPSDLEKA